MDPIVTIALVGTARQEQVKLATDTPVDALIAKLPEGEVERTFLLSAGAWAIYRQAGMQPLQLESGPEPAAAEHLRACSPKAALLLSRLLNREQEALLPEALECMRQHGMHLPYPLLPLALSKTNKETRVALVPVLGERGRWLSRWNPSWQWVRHAALDASTHGLPPEAETIWQEGSLDQRVEILRRLRAADPAQARAWLEATWKQEKAEARRALLSALEVGLSTDDEVWLEKVLDERATSVRAVAAALLTSLPASALGERMRERGQNMLKMANGQLGLELPATLEKSWLRDGITETPAHRIGPRAWWLSQVLAAIPPTFWEAQFGAGPAELLARLPDNPWKINVIEGWSQAALKHNAQDWLHTLWLWWYEHHQQACDTQELGDYTLRERLLQQMPGAVAEQIILNLINEHASIWGELLPELARPWSSEFARVYLRLFREHCSLEKLEAERLDLSTYLGPWVRNLPDLPLALPVACLAEAAQPWDLLTSTQWQIQNIHQSFQNFSETVQMRQKIHEEIV